MYVVTLCSGYSLRQPSSDRIVNGFYPCRICVHLSGKHRESHSSPCRLRGLDGNQCTLQTSAISCATAAPFAIDPDAHPTTARDPHCRRCIVFPGFFPHPPLFVTADPDPLAARPNQSLHRE